MLEKIQDRNGNFVYLTDERWKHIIKSHHQLTGLREAVLSTIRSGKRKQDQLLVDKYYYTKTFPGLFKRRFAGIKVVVVFRRQNGQPNNYVVTAYPI